jgi:hypothetical protein
MGSDKGVQSTRVARYRVTTKLDIDINNMASAAGSGTGDELKLADPKFALPKLDLHEV